MIYFFQFVFSGVLLGLLYSVVALGLTVVWRSSRIINLAQGELVILGGFLIWLFVSVIPFPHWWMGLALAFALMALLGLVIERVIFRPLVGQPEFALVMTTIGLLILLRGLMIAFFGAEPRLFPEIFPGGGVTIGPIVVRGALLYGGIISLLLILGLVWFLERTRLGFRLSAVAEHHQIAESLGISVKQAIAVAWIMAVMLGGFASIVFLNGGTLSFVASEIGFRALPVALLAGMESVRGAPLAGLVIGVGESLARGYIDPLTGGGMAAVFPFIVMVIAILVRPQGFFGWKIIERV